jgi:hypothetical protein
MTFEESVMNEIAQPTHQARSAIESYLMERPGEDFKLYQMTGGAFERMHRLLSEIDNERRLLYFKLKSLLPKKSESK